MRTRSRISALRHRRAIPSLVLVAAPSLAAVACGPAPESEWLIAKRRRVE